MIRNIIILMVVAVAIVVAVFVISNKGEVSEDFGNATIKLLEDNKTVLACDDAKTLYSMILKMNNEDRETPEEFDSENNTSQGMIEFEDATMKFNSKLEIFYQNDPAGFESAQYMMGEAVSQMVVVSTMESVGSITSKESTEYLNIQFCGAKPKDGWVSPFDPNGMN